MGEIILEAPSDTHVHVDYCTGTASFHTSGFFPGLASRKLKVLTPFLSVNGYFGHTLVSFRQQNYMVVFRHHKYFIRFS